MSLSKRERIIILTTIVVVGALIGDRLIRAPLADRWADLKNQRQQLLTQVAKAKNLLQQRQVEERKHKALFDEGLKNATEAESRLAKAIDKWSADASLALTSVTPSRLAGGDKGLKEIVFVVAGKGSLNAVSWFLYQAETSELPVKVKYMQLSSTSESGQDMSMELRLSTLYVAAADEKSSSPTRSGAAGKQAQPKQRGTTNEEQL
jgi:hypothetical protein